MVSFIHFVSSSLVRFFSFVFCLWFRRRRSAGSFVLRYSCVCCLIFFLHFLYLLEYTRQHRILYFMAAREEGRRKKKEEEEEERRRGINLIIFLNYNIYN